MFTRAFNATQARCGKPECWKNIRSETKYLLKVTSGTFTTHPALGDKNMTDTQKAIIFLGICLGVTALCQIAIALAVWLR
jgi:hypothetical protein